MTRCTCKTGQDLTRRDLARANPEPQPPVLTREATAVFVEMMQRLDFYPAKEDADRLLIAEEIRSMVHSEEEAFWLVQRMNRLYRKWPGIIDLRMVYCSKFQPLDAIESTAQSQVYPDGIPSERQLAPQDQKYIGPGPGEAASAAESVSLTVEALVKSKSLQNAGKRLVVPTIPLLPKANRITPADISQAIEVNRNRAAKEELGEPTE